MKIKHYDYLIVGLGVAGALMTYRLRAAGKSVVVFNDDRRPCASLVAAGIINPVTGKKFVKSWQIDLLLKEAITCYSWIEKQENISLLHKMNIVRVLPDIGAENSWLSRKQDPAYAPFVMENASLESAGEKLHTPSILAEISQSYRVDLSCLIGYLKDILQYEYAYHSEVLQYENLKRQDGLWQYGHFTTNGVIFCEGYKGIHNPFFGDPGFTPSGGEAVFVKIPGLGLEKMYKDELFIVPLGNDNYWVGGGYNIDADHTGEAGIQRLKAHISKITDMKFDILSYHAAWRPATKYRRPFLMQHPSLDSMYLLNGLGTKGASLAPWLTSLLYAHLTDNIPLPGSFV